VAVAMMLLSSAAACGGGAKGGTPAGKVTALEVTLPGGLAGLNLQPEHDSSQLANTNLSTYVKAVSLYSLRQKDLVKGTLQISEFNNPSKFRSPKFRTTLVNRIANGTPVVVRVGKSIVYLARGVRQSVAVWFNGRYFLVLTTRVDFDRPRTLLRSAVDVPL
jgi:hypothetical protein